MYDYDNVTPMNSVTAAEHELSRTLSYLNFNAFLLPVYSCCA